MVDILVVDDSTMIRNQLKRIFTKAGYNVIAEADDGDVAVEKYKELKPDIITLDINMPKVNGIEALKQIRTFDSNAKIIMCTAMNQKAFMDQSFELGACDYVTKPLQPVKLLEICKKLA